MNLRRILAGRRDFARRLPIVGRNTSYQPYLIFADARSGSTLLAFRLNSHRQVDGLAELFEPNSLSAYSQKWWQPALLRTVRMGRLERLRRDDPVAFVKSAGWGPRSRAVRAAGFKFIWGQFAGLTATQREQILSEPGLKVILLEREDVLGQFVSRVSAEQFGVWHVRMGQKRPALPKIVFDHTDFVEYLRQRKLMAFFIRNTTRHLPRHCVTYEDLIAHPARENSRLCRFLGIDDVPLTDTLQRLSTTSLADRVENIDALIASLRNTEHETYLAAAGLD